MNKYYSPLLYSDLIGVKDVHMLLYWHCFYGCTQEVTDIVSRRKELNIDALYKFQGESQTALHAACLNNHPKIVGVLLKARADVNIQSSFTRCTPLHYACGLGHLECVELLLKTGRCDFG